LRVAFSAVALGGQVLDLDAAGVQAWIDGREVTAPCALGRFTSHDVPVALVLVVETAGAYRDVLPAIVGEIDGTLLAGLPPGTRVAVVGYGSAVAATALGSITAARDRLAALTVDDADAAPVLADAVDRAVAIVAAAPATDRRLVVAIGDGRDAAGDDARITARATAAGAAGIRIHAIAYTPVDARSPLRALGELAKQSLGTFRWVRGGVAESWQPALAQLREQIASRYVATWFVADASAAGKPLRLVTTGRVAMTSNPVIVVPPPGRDRNDDGGKLGPAVAVLAGMPVLVAILAVLVARRRRRR
jgi:hypothetical protein